MLEDDIDDSGAMTIPAIAPSPAAPTSAPAPANVSPLHRGIRNVPAGWT